MNKGTTQQGSVIVFLVGLIALLIIGIAGYTYFQKDISDDQDYVVKDLSKPQLECETYISEDYKYSFQYPPSLEFQEADVSNGVKLQYFGDEQGTSLALHDGIIVQVYFIDETIQISEFIDWVYQRESQNYGIEKDSLQIQSQDGYEAILVGKNVGDIKSSTKYILYPDGLLSFSIGYSALNVEVYEKIAEQIYNSWSHTENISLSQ